MGKKFLFNPIGEPFDVVAGETEYLQASKANDQINFDTGDDVIYDTIDRVAGSAISLNTSTGVFTLKAGKTYELTCGIRYEHTTATRIGFAWYNITNSVEISMRARIMNMKETGDYSNLPIAQAIITPDVDTEVTVRCIWEGDGVEDVNAGHTWVIIKKISESIYNVMTVGSIDEKLKRVDNDAFETAQAGVEYYSPIQNGRKDGIVYRQYFTTSLPSDLTSGNNVSNLVDYKLVVTGGGNRHILSGYTYTSAATESFLILTGTSGNNNLNLAMGALFTLVEGYVDYTK